MENKIVSLNNNVLVRKKLDVETDNGISYTNEIKGDGEVIPCTTIEDCKVTGRAEMLSAGTLIYVPGFALREVKKDLFSCDIESIIAYETV